MDAGTPFEWDEAKSQRCLRERGFDFRFAARVLLGGASIRADERDYGDETRFQAIGRVDGRLYLVAFTWRGEFCRIISARRAKEKELSGWRR